MWWPSLVVYSSSKEIKQEIVGSQVRSGELSLLALPLHRPTSRFSMTTRKADLLLLRTPFSPLSSDPYDSALAPLCSSLAHLPVLDTRLLPATLSTILADERAPAERYSGVIITSARAVRAWELAAREAGARGGWKQLPFFVVGRATSDALLGVSNCPTTSERVYGAESGTGERLAHFMREWFGAERGEGEVKPLLYLVGDKNKETIQQILREGKGGVETDRVQVYETEVVESFGADLEAALGSSTSPTSPPSAPTTLPTPPPPITYLALFSPSSALPCVTHLRRLALLPPLSSTSPTRSSSTPSQLKLTLRFIAIGPVTSNYLIDEQGIPAEDVLVAEKPEAESIRDVLEKDLEGL